MTEPGFSGVSGRLGQCRALKHAGASLLVVCSLLAAHAGASVSRPPSVSAEKAAQSTTANNVQQVRLPPIRILGLNPGSGEAGSAVLAQLSRPPVRSLALFVDDVPVLAKSVD